MEKIPNSQAGAIYTLAQTGTIKKNTTVGQRPFIIVTGEGSDLMNMDCQKERAKRKHNTQALVLTLIDIAKEEGNEKLIKSLWNTYYCLNEVYVSNGRVHGKYCKNKICTVCLCIRKAELINKYLSMIETWEDAHFLTLTIRSVRKERLRALLKNMIKGFNRITARYRKRNREKGEIRLIGVRSIECEFNPKKQTYNPHFHIIVKCREAGQILMREWVKESKKKSKTIYAELWCQDLQKVTDPVNCLIEIVKYGSKIFTETDVDKKANNGDAIIYAKALYSILVAMQGLRLFDRFGFNLPKGSKKKSSTIQTLHDYRDYIFEPAKADWVDSESGTPLTEFVADPKTEYLLENCINRELC